MNRRRFVFCAATGLMVPATLRGAAPTPFGFFKPAAASDNGAAATAALNDWVTRVQGRGSDVTIAGTQAGVLAFIRGLMDDGVWSKLVRMSIYAGDGLAALEAPLKNGGPSATDTLSNFVSGDYSQALGLTGSTSASPAKNLQTGLPFDSGLMGDTDIHVSMYARTGPDAGVAMQVSGSGFGGLYLPTLSVGTAIWYVNSNTDTISVTDVNGTGHYIGTRTSSSSSALYLNGVAIGSSASAGGTRIVCDIRFHAFSPGATSPTGRTLEFYSVGTGLTAADAANLTARYATLRAALGRDWAGSVVRLGGAAPSAGTVSALNTFYAGLSTAGILHKMIAVNAIAPDSLTAAIVPFIHAAGDELWTNTSFVGGDLTVNGLKGDGSSKYLNTGIAPTALIVPSTNFGMTIVSPDSASNNTGLELGSANTLNSNNDVFLGLNLTGNANWESCGFGSGWDIQVAQAGNGYYSGNRVSTTNLKLYFASQSSAHSQIGSATTATGAANASVMFAFAVRNTATSAPAAFSNKRLSFIAAHLGLTSAESSAFYALVAALRTSLGGGNP